MIFVVFLLISVLFYDHMIAFGSIKDVNNKESSDVKLEGRLTIPDGTSASNIMITLNGQEYETITKLDGSFEFPSVYPGIYLLDVLSIRYTFPQMKIRIVDQTNTNKSRINVLLYYYPGAKKVPYTSEYLQLRALYPNEYFQVRPPFSLIGWITGNPMILLMLGSLAIVIYFPKLLEGIDPEVLKEYQKEMQGNSANKDEDKMVEDDN